MSNKKCLADDCYTPPIKNGLCNKHNLRMKRYGRLHKIRRDQGSGTKTSKGYITIACKYQHRIIAENVLGKKLPKGSQVHHVDGDKTNNANSNLVICPNAGYHSLLHKRARAYDRGELRPRTSGKKQQSEDV